MLEAYYLPIKALHILSVIAWMAGLLYLPRLFVYHKENEKDKGMYRVFLTMEERLIKMIMIPAFCSSLLTGTLLLHMPRAVNWSTKTPYCKLSLVFLLFCLQVFFYRCWKNFQHKRNKYSSVFFRTINEVPFLIAIGIVFLAVMKPF